MEECIDFGANFYFPPHFNSKKIQTSCFYSEFVGKKFIYAEFNGVEKIFYPYTMCYFPWQGALRENCAKKQYISYVADVEWEEFFGYIHIRNWIIYSMDTKEVFLNSIMFNRFIANMESLSILNWDKVSEYLAIFDGVDGSINVYKANTTYLFNYEGSPNEDVFFINNFERGGLIEDVPYKPTREGYEFGGWYKEPECINKWNFDLDTLPVPEYDSDGELIFNETKLYAKWI